MNKANDKVLEDGITEHLRIAADSKATPEQVSAAVAKVNLLKKVQEEL